MAEPIVIVASGVVVVDAAVAAVAAMATASAAIATAKIVGRSLVRIAAIVRHATIPRKSTNRGATSLPSRRVMQPLMPMRCVGQNLRNRNLVNPNPPNPRSKPGPLKVAMKVRAADAAVGDAVGVVVDVTHVMSVEPLHRNPQQQTSNMLRPIRKTSRRCQPICMLPRPLLLKSR